MTRNDIRNLVASNLGDPTFAQFTTDAIDAAIQDAYNVIVTLCLCLQNSVDLPQLPNQVYYKFGELITERDLLAISAIFNYNTNRWLIPVNRAQLDEMCWDWEIMNGEPCWFNPENWRYTCVVPHNTGTVTKGFRVFYRTQADVLDDTTVPSLPPQAIQAIEFYATKDQFESIREFIKAVDFKAKYLAKIPEIRKLTRQLAFADKVNVMAPAQIMGTFALSSNTSNSWAVNEVPGGVQDGENSIFTLAHIPNPTRSIIVFLNGVILLAGYNYFYVFGTLDLSIHTTPPNSANGDTFLVCYQHL